MTAIPGIHPELERIRIEYQELYDSVVAGHVPEDEAKELLRNITAVDADAAVWSFDPYSGDLMRALPGLPPQRASADMFAASRLPAPDVYDPGPARPSLPSSGPEPGFGLSFDEDYDLMDGDMPMEPSSGRRLSIPVSLRPLVRPIVVGVVFVATASFLVMSRVDADRASDADPEVVAPAAPVADRDGFVSPPSSTRPSPGPPPVEVSADGEVIPLSRDAAQYLFEGLLAQDTSILSAEGWTRVYALPLLGASASGYEMEVVDWVVDRSGRDRLTVTIDIGPDVPPLRWWVFVAPEGGVWMISGIEPLPSR